MDIPKNLRQIKFETCVDEIIKFGTDAIVDMAQEFPEIMMIHEELCDIIAHIAAKITIEKGLLEKEDK